MSSNKKLGSDFEKELAKILSGNGFWAMVIPDDKNGQPFDVIGAKNNRVYAFECKTCKTKMFNIDRIEVNQIYAFGHFIDKGNENCFFTFKYKNNIYLEWAEVVINTLNKQKSIDVSKLRSLDEWLL